MTASVASSQKVIEIPIISNSNFDLTKFIFSHFDIYLADIRTSDFRDYIKTFAQDQIVDNNFNLNIILDNPDKETFYAIIKKD